MRFPLSQDDSHSLAILAAELVESDAAYFEAAANLEKIPGAVLAWMKEFPALSAAGVVHRIEVGLGDLAPEAWLSLVEDAVHQVGRMAVRIYLATSHPELEAALRRRGYRARRELGFLGRANPGSIQGLRPVSIRLIEAQGDWAVKDALHRLWDVAPDGHPVPDGEWAALERRKVEAGYMQPFLVLAGSTVCGTVSLAHRDRLDRMKNLVLHPHWTGRGVGSAVVGAMTELAGLSGRPLGVFALAGGGGELLYRKLGFVLITDQTEWFRRLEP